MKLVVVWEDGDGCTYSCEVVAPVEYESAEALAVNLEEFCKAYQIRHDEHNAFARNRDIRKFKAGSPEYKAWFAEWEKRCAEFDYSNNFPGTNLYASSFIQDDGSYTKKVYVAPAIYTLDEWWEQGARLQ